jgi:hypothetical protein
MKTIEIVIAPTGAVRLQTRGFAGRSCLTASRFLEAALGRTTSDRLSSDFYAAAERQHETVAQRQHPS